MKKFFTGNEAIAYGFFIYGGQFASGYPGTPSTEILENIAKLKGLYSEWAPNEKVAVESAIGASYAGFRSLVAMKHVGVNVASDPIFTLAYTGVNAGLIIVSADDPGIYSSQNEQDNRNYSKFAKIPMLEPSNSQECFDFVKLAFIISESYKIPIFIRLTTRICHSKSIVYINENRTANFLPINKEKRFDPIPSISRRLHIVLEQKLLDIAKNTNNYPLVEEENNNSDIGIITSGVCYNYVKEVFGNSVSILKLNMVYPISYDTIKRFLGNVKNLYVIEELDPFIEEQILAFGISCIGKKIVPKVMDLTPQIIRNAFNIPSHYSFMNKSNYVATNKNKSKAFCDGCFYNIFFKVLSNYKNLIISSDIGCYSMSGGEPYYVKDIAICMGGGFSIAHGIQKALSIQGISQRRVIGIMGDSTFFHSGITSLINVIYNKSNPILVVLDNKSTSMTGLQDNPGTGKTLQNDYSKPIDIFKLLQALNIENIREFNPFSLIETTNSLEWAISQNSLVVLIAKGKCILKGRG